jgi:hypothetical protein
MKKISPLKMLLFFTIAVSCTNENSELNTNPEPVSIENPSTPPFEEENPITEFLVKSEFSNITVPCIKTKSYAEIGFVFKPVAKGVVNSITVKLPSIYKNIKITFWNFDKRSVIRTETCDVDLPNSEIKLRIDPLELSKNVKYAITVYTNSYYMRHSEEWKQPLYPIIVGNIKILQSIMNYDSTLSYQTTTSLGNFYNGDCSFNFLRTE